MKNTNFVIKAESPEHAKKILEYFISLGSVEDYIAKDYPFSIKRPYYGFINKIFGTYSYRFITENHALITELPPEPKRGDWVYVSDKPIDPSNPLNKVQKAIYLTKIEGATYPFVTVYPLTIDAFKNGDTFGTVKWKFMMPIPKTPKTFTLEDVEMIFEAAREMKQTKVKGIAWEYVYETFEDYLKTM